MYGSKMISRRTFLATAGMLGFSGIASACGGATNPAPTAVSKSTTPESTATPIASPTPPPIVQLNYFFPGYASYCLDIGMVEDALSKVTAERINAKIKLNLVEWDNYTQKLNLMSAASEQYDFCFTNSWVNGFHKNVENGQFLALDDLLPVYAPKYWQSMPPMIWGAAKIRGKHYGAIHQQLFPRIYGFAATRDLVEKYKLDLSQVGNWHDVESWLDAIVKAEGFPPWPVWPYLYMDEVFSRASIDDGIGWTHVSKDDKHAKVVNTISTDAYADIWGLEKKWYEKGYIVRENTQGDEYLRLFRTGKAAIYAWFIKPGGEFEIQTSVQRRIVLKALSQPILSTSSIIFAMTGISRTTNSKETSARWLELINTDKPTLNLLCLGIEGTHWNWKSREQEVIEQVKDTKYDPSPDFLFGNQFNVYYRDERQVGAWDESRKINDTATPAPTLGFVMDREPIKNELAAINATVAEWTPYGPKGKLASELPKLVDVMNAAGAKKVMTEMQRQIDAWLATK